MLFITYILSSCGCKIKSSWLVQILIGLCTKEQKNFIKLSWCIKRAKYCLIALVFISLKKPDVKGCWSIVNHNNWETLFSIFLLRSNRLLKGCKIARNLIEYFYIIVLDKYTILENTDLYQIKFGQKK